MTRAHHCLSVSAALFLLALVPNPTEAGTKMVSNGAFDLLIGEGSYSANAIHLLVNQGSNERPAFSTAHRHFLVFGDGREHLLPAIVDYNDNGYPDLIIADRNGRWGVHLHPNRNWEPGDELIFSHYIKIEDRENLGGLVAPRAADVNGNALFDLLVGRNNGRLNNRNLIRYGRA